MFGHRLVMILNGTGGRGTWQQNATAKMYGIGKFNGIGSFRG
jgi:hypothetical protein